MNPPADPIATRALLVAVDGSERAQGVVDRALELAKAMGARIVLFRAIVVPPDFPPAAATTEVDTLPSYMAAQARAALTSLAARGITAGVPFELRVEETSQPWRAILAAAESIDADVIVLGSHGYHGWDHVLGTTAGKVANVAHRSVFVVHDRERPSGVSP